MVYNLAGIHSPLSLHCVDLVWVLVLVCTADTRMTCGFVVHVVGVWDGVADAESTEAGCSNARHSINSPRPLRPTWSLLRRSTDRPCLTTPNRARKRAVRSLWHNWRAKSSDPGMRAVDRAVYELRAAPDRTTASARPKMTSRGVTLMIAGSRASCR